ncbi:MAG: phosphoribosylanthranilate isomerase [Bryobacterales bacterium]|jgi:phosphoribosylanthranilate isomerase|nr:phosphoribosylanthranilate isomerase [Bryobacterales bacterium]
MFVKICGITNREDAMAAVDAGATALGFIFYDRSSRAVTAAALESWIADLPPNVWKVGVYVDETPGNIGRISRRLNLDVAQLHGAETPDLYPQNIRIWKAIRLGTNPGHADTSRVFPGADEFPGTEAILFDGPGNGQTFKWSLAANFTKPVILAGGLTPDNVHQAIEQTNPWGVDTASGVEASPGRKDHARMKLFIKEALRPCLLRS